MVFAIVKKKPRVAGLFEISIDDYLGEGRLVDDRLRRPGPLATFLQDLRGRLPAGAATRGDTQLTLQVPETLRPGLCRLADLLVGNRVTDAYVHEFNHLLCFMRVNRKCE